MHGHIYGLINGLTDCLLFRLQTCLATFRCLLGRSAQPFCRVRGRSGERSSWALCHSQSLSWTAPILGRCRPPPLRSRVASVATALARASSQRSALGIQLRCSAVPGARPLQASTALVFGRSDHAVVHAVCACCMCMMLFNAGLFCFCIHECSLLA